MKPRSPASSLASLWVFDVDTKQERRLTSDANYSVSDVTLSRDGKWIGFRGMSPSRYERGNLEQNDYSDLYLHVASGAIERLTKNDIISEGGITFSPDNKLVAYSAPDDFKFMHNERIYVRHVDQPSEPWKKIGGNFDGDVRAGGRGGGGGEDGVQASFWSANSDTIYFGTGVRATTQFFAASIASGQAKQITDVKGTIQVTRDEESGRVLITFADPKTPPAMYVVASLAGIGDRAKWTQVTDPNAWARREIALGDEEEIVEVDGRHKISEFSLPVGYQAGESAIVAIHGGPAAAAC